MAKKKKAKAAARAGKKKSTKAAKTSKAPKKPRKSTPKPAPGKKSPAAGRKAGGKAPKKGKRADTPASGTRRADPAPPQAAPSQATKPAKPVKPSPKKPTYATADSLAKNQRHISVSEFFAKNRHLLGFDNPRKALLTTIKEAVDNSLDACEEAGISPVVELWIEQVNDTNYRVTIQDNGPGIVRQQIPNIFGRLLYGSKFHAMKMSRGQQGIGISAAGMYGLLTTGRNIQITSRIGRARQAHYYELRIDTKKNRPDVIREELVDWDVPRGTKVTIELVARYQKGRASVDEYLQQTAIANPHATLIYHAPDGRNETYAAVSEHVPPAPKAVRPHPYGVELGVLIKMLHDTRARTIQQFLTHEFSRVSPRVAGEILERADLSARANPTRCARQDAHRLHEAIQSTKIMAPRTDCVVPIGQEQLLEGLRQVVPAEFATAVTRSPAVYRGNAFVIEAALAYGQAAGSPDRTGPAEEPSDEPNHKASQPLVRIVRFANRVPLLYQQSACAIYKGVVQTAWKSYGLSQSRGAPPAGPATIVVHIASVWVPFTSESKEAVADYPEIAKEVRLALQECGRRLGVHVRRQVRHRDELKKRSYIEKYIPHIGIALGEILDLKDRQIDRVNTQLKDILERSRKM